MDKVVGMTKSSFKKRTPVLAGSPVFMAFIIFTAMLTTCSCSLFQSSDKAFVANASAERLYQVDRYNRLCSKPLSTSCIEMQNILNGLEDSSVDPVTSEKKVWGLIPKADQVQQIGALPSQEKSEITKLLKRLEKLP